MVNPQLLNYVRSQLAAGVNKDALTKAIVAQGWSAQDAQDAFAQAATAVPQKVSEPKSHSGIIAACIVLLFCGAAVGGYYYYYAHYVGAAPVGQSPVLQTGQGSIASTTQAVLPDSGSASNGVYVLQDISFTYPPGWVVQYATTPAAFPVRATFHPADNASTTLSVSMIESTSSEAENVSSYVSYHKQTVSHWTLAGDDKVSVAVQGGASSTVSGDMLTATYSSQFGAYNDEQKTLTFIYKGNQYIISGFAKQSNWSGLLPLFDAALASVKIKS